MRVSPSVLAMAVGRSTRRDVVALVGAALAAAGPVRAQRPAVATIGYLGSEAPGPYESRLKAFGEGLAEAGFVDGRNVTIDYRWAEGDYGRLPSLARQLAEAQVTVMVAPGGAEVALAAKSATATIPIVFEMGGDPVALGVVDSLSRPGGNLTGVSSLSVEVSRKRLEFMHELFPTSERIAVAVNPASPTSATQMRNLHVAADNLGVRLRELKASAEAEFDAMFAAAAELQSGLVFTSDPYFAYRSQRLAVLAAQHAVPTITQSRDFPIAGGLMSYGGDFTQSHRHTGIYAGRILKGERPAELPVQRVTKVELFVNLKAAQALGIAVPASLSSSADVVIE